MCEIMDQLFEEERKEARKLAIVEGRAEGVVFVLRSMKYETEEIVSYLIDNLDMSRDEAYKSCF